MNKKGKIILTLISIFLTISLIMNIALIIENNEKPKTSSITYISISTRNDYIYANFNIETNQEIILLKENFSILIDNTPMTSSGIIEGYYGTSPIIGNDIKINKDTTIIVAFDHKYSETNNPQFLYNGKKLKLGETVFINK